MKKIILIMSLIIFVISGFIIILYRYEKPKAEIAFVIDDWGYNNKNLDLLFKIERPVTLAILPDLRYSNHIAKEAVNKKMYDAILHLPLESISGDDAEVNTIKTSMDKARILSILHKDIDGMPGIIGVSNHQGSRATENKRVMKIIMAGLKKKRLFYLDSGTSPDSVCREVSREERLKFAERDVFLDLTDEADPNNLGPYVKGQIRELAGVALTKGSAIGIGHNKSVTLKVINEMIPELEKQKIKIVPLKRLVK